MSSAAIFVYSTLKVNRNQNIPVKSQCMLSPQLCTKLVWLHFSSIFSTACLIGQKSICCSDLIKVEQIRTPMLSKPETISAESEVKVRESSCGEDGKKTISVWNQD